MANDVSGEDLLRPLYQPLPILVVSFPLSHAVKICLTPRTPLRKQPDIPTQCTISSPISAWYPEHILFSVHGKSHLSLWAGEAFPRRTDAVHGLSGVATQGRISCYSSTGYSEAILFPLYSETLLSSSAEAGSVRRSDRANLTFETLSTALKLFFISTAQQSSGS